MNNSKPRRRDFSEPRRVLKETRATQTDPELTGVGTYAEGARTCGDYPRCAGPKCACRKEYEIRFVSKNPVIL